MYFQECNSGFFPGHDHTKIIVLALDPHDTLSETPYPYDDHTHTLDSPRILTDSVKDEAISYTYLPYGESTESITDSDASTNRYRFTAREYETAYMNFYRSRYYNNRMGRFYSKVYYVR